VVAYEDLNGNGKLDIVPDDAGAFVDKIVGANATRSIGYLTATPASDNNLADSFGKWPSRGYNLYDIVACSPSATDGSRCNQNDDPIHVWFGLDASYDLAISDDPEVNQTMCANYAQGGGAVSTSSSWDVDQNGTPPGGYPAAGAQGLTCLGASSYTISQCQTTHTGLCSESHDCTLTTVALGKAAKPASWPCP
jgi:hypothetical protein